MAPSQIVIVKEEVVKVYSSSTNEVGYAIKTIYIIR